MSEKRNSDANEIHSQIVPDVVYLLTEDKDGVQRYENVQSAKRGKGDKSGGKGSSHK